MGVYLGTQNNSLANIGKSATFAQIKVAVGNTVIADETFDTIDEFELLDPNVWERIASLNSAHIINTDHAVWMTWTLPDAGWTPASSGNLIDWDTIDAEPFNVGGTRRVLLQGDAIPVGNSGYFRMQMGN